MKILKNIKVNREDLTAIENMIININNDYVKRIQDLEKENTNLTKELDSVYHEKCIFEMKLDKALNTIETQKKEIELGTKANKVLEDRIKELKNSENIKKTITEYLSDCRNLLTKANEIFQENKFLKKETKKNIKAYETTNVSAETRKKLK